MKTIAYIAFLVSLVFYMVVTLNGLSNDIESVQRTIQSSVEQNQSIQNNIQQRHLTERIQTYKKEIECLATNMYFEARGEGEQGQNAVAFVTINRVRSNRYPDNVCDVVYQARTYANGHPIRNQCQFSWYCDGKVDTVIERIYNRIYRRAEYIYVNYHLNDLMNDTTDGATHYHTEEVNPYWSRHRNYKYVANIGHHVFYQPTYD